jgi:hypothetical protein
MSKRANQRPVESVKFILCEDVRSEVQAKVSLLGIYPGETVRVIGDAPPEMQDAKAAISSLAFAFFVSNAKGKLAPRLQFTDPRGIDGPPLDLAETAFEPGKSSTIAALAKPFIVSAFGEYSVTLQLGATAHKFAFYVEKGSSSDLHNAGIPLTQPSAKRRGKYKKASNVTMRKSAVTKG